MAVLCVGEPNHAAVCLFCISVSVENLHALSKFNILHTKVVPSKISESYLNTMGFEIQSDTFACYTECHSSVRLLPVLQLESASEWD